MRGRNGKFLVAVVGVGVSAVFLWLAVRNADLDAVRRTLSEAQLGLVLLAVLVIGVGYGFQAERWRLIAAAPSLGLRSFYGMLLGGLACNNVLPVRIGEFLRAGWLSRDAPMSGGRAFGSVVLDRICDIVTLAVFIAIGLQAVASAAWLVRLAVGALLAVVADRRHPAARADLHQTTKSCRCATGHVDDSFRSFATPSRCWASRSAAAAPQRGSV